MKTTIHTLLAALAALALGAPAQLLAAEKKTEKPAAEKPATPDEPKKKPAAEAGAKAIPYHGKVGSVDASAKTFTIKGKEKDRVISLTDSTKITKEGAAADIGAIAPGEDVRGQLRKNGDKWEAVSVMIGAKPATEKKAKKTDKPAESKPADAKPAEKP